MTRIFQYVPLIRARALERILPRVIGSGASAVMDLEDSVQDPLYPENTPLLKAEARKGLINLIAKHPALFSNREVYVRVNSMRSDEYDKDMDEICSLVPKFSPAGVFLPMVESSEDVKRCYERLRDSGYSDFTIVPIIETVSGLDNLDEILAPHAGTTVKYVHYGHFDYCLSAEMWPFPRQNSRAFWHLVDALVQRVEDCGCFYIHTPFPELDNADMFRAVRARLAKVCRKELSLSALNLDQALVDFSLESSSFLDEELDLSDHELGALACETIAAYEGHRASKRSFSIDAHLFIPPHEYWAAKTYLRKSGQDKSVI